jgi:hypothetical protein
MSLNPDKLPIVVLTPVKNEAWILERFLATTSYFADLIIIADQQSDDGSVEIAKSFPKVHLISNQQVEYDEASRQKLLIGEARKIVDGPKLLLALDADEIATGDSVGSLGWQTIFKQKAGTVIHFEKPDLLFPLEHCHRKSDFFPLGYVDDGAEHTGRKIHSPRVPIKLTSPRLMVNEIKFMHYALTREREYWARQRYYSILENVNKTSNLITRLRNYSASVFEAKKPEQRAIPASWFSYWQQEGIDMTSIQTSDANHYNLRALQLLQSHRDRFFQLDDIWQLDWAGISENDQASDPINSSAQGRKLEQEAGYRLAQKALIRLLKHI